VGNKLGNEEKRMAGKPTPHGKGWRVFWKNPLTGTENRHPVWSYDDGMMLKRWLENLDPPNGIDKEDDQIVFGVFRGSSIPAHRRAPQKFGAYAKNLFDASEKSSKKTQIRKWNRIRRHCAEWLDEPIVMIDRKRIKIWMEGLEKTARQPRGETIPQMLAPKTRALIIGHVKEIFAAAEAEKIIGRSPFEREPANGNHDKIYFKSVTNAEGLRRPEQVLISRLEFKKLLKAASEVDALGLYKHHVRSDNWHLHETQTADTLWTLMETGCRIGEIHSLEVRQVYVLANNPNPILALEEWQRKNRKKAAIPISAELAQHLQKYVIGRPMSARVFPATIRGDSGWDSGTWRNRRWNRLVSIAREKHNLEQVLEPKPHAIRKSTATWLLDGGLQMRDVADNLGNTLEVIENHYAMQSLEQAHKSRHVKTSFPRPLHAITPAVVDDSPPSRKKFIADYMAKGLSEEDATILADARGLTDGPPTRKEFIANYVAKGISEEDAMILADAYGLSVVRLVPDDDGETA
jgi:integrase